MADNLGDEKNIKQEQPLDFFALLLWAFFMLVAFGYPIFLLAESGLDWDYWQPEGVEDRSAIVRNLVFGFAGIVGIGLATWRSITAWQQAHTANEQAKIATEQFELAQKGHANDRFVEGVKMLDSGDKQIRIAGLVVLRDVATEYPQQHANATLDILGIFTCNQSWKRKEVKEIHRKYRADSGKRIMQRIRQFRPDIDLRLALEILQSINSLNEINDLGKRKIEIKNASFSGLDFVKYRFDHFQFVETLVIRAEFINCDFSNTKILGSDFCGAYIALCDFKHAEFQDVNLSGCVFSDNDNLDQRQLDGAWTWADMKPDFQGSNSGLEIPNLRHPNKRAKYFGSEKGALDI